MDWRKILSFVAWLSVVLLLVNTCGGCIRDTSSVIDWEDCSQQIGDHPCDFTLVDQKGNDFNLYDHVGKIIIIDLSAMWCGPCQIAALEVEELQEKYKDDIVYVTILIENTNYNPPTRSNISHWAKSFGIKSAPVLGASRNFISNKPDDGWPLEAWPQFHIINKEMIFVDSFKGWGPGLIESKIQEHILLSSEGS